MLEEEPVVVDDAMGRQDGHGESAGEYPVEEGRTGAVESQDEDRPERDRDQSRKVGGIVARGAGPVLWRSS